LGFFSKALLKLSEAFLACPIWRLEIGLYETLGELDSGALLFRGCTPTQSSNPAIGLKETFISPLIKKLSASTTKIQNEFVPTLTI